MMKKTKFMCVLVGFIDVIATYPETGIYIVPITVLSHKKVNITIC